MPERMAPRKKTQRWSTTTKLKRTKRPVSSSTKKSNVSQQWLNRYHDPSAPGSLGGVQRFAKAQGLPLKKAQQVLERDVGYTLHKPRRRRFATLPVIVGGLDDQWAADLVEVQRLAKHNRGIRYLLTVVDVLSKYAWVQPLKTKTGVALVKAFEKIVRQGGRHPNRLQTDRGKEFYNRTFQRWVDEQDIHHFSTEGDAKASVVERFNRTLKERLYRYLTTANTLRFDNVLPQLVQGYNATRHRSIGMPPEDVTWDNEEAVWKRLYSKRLKGQKKPQFKVGDRVRLNTIHRTFEKGYLPGWTEEVFVVHRVIPGPVPTYKIHEWDETPIQGTFYEEDLQKVQVSDVFRIEKVLKRQKDRWLVKWKGWPDKYNSWIARGDVTSLRPRKRRRRR